jgi:hypothetical protein
MILPLRAYPKYAIMRHKPLKMLKNLSETFGIYRRVSLPNDGMADGMARLVSTENRIYRQGQESF